MSPHLLIFFFLDGAGTAASGGTGVVSVFRSVIIA